jgi:hypothetical protein
VEDDATKTRGCATNPSTGSWTRIPTPAPRSQSFVWHRPERRAPPS